MTAEVYVILKPVFNHSYKPDEMTGFKVDSVRQKRPKGKIDGLVMTLNLTLPRILFEPKLDAKVDKLDAKVERIGNDVAELKGRISQLPSTIQLLGFVLAVLAISGAVRVFTP